MKKGFTLVELLVVIVVLGLLATIVYPSVLGIINTGKKETLDSQKKIIVKAAKEWGVKNYAKLPDNECFVSVNTLIDEGYISSDFKTGDKEAIKDPQGSILNGFIKIKYESNQYTYTYTDNGGPSC